MGMGRGGGGKAEKLKMEKSISPGSLHNTEQN
jgi:hypothetical protein